LGFLFGGCAVGFRDWFVFFEFLRFGTRENKEKLAIAMG